MTLFSAFVDLEAQDVCAGAAVSIFVLCGAAWIGARRVDMAPVGAAPVGAAAIGAVTLRDGAAPVGATVARSDPSSNPVFIFLGNEVLPFFEAILFKPRM